MESAAGAVKTDKYQVRLIWLGAIVILGVVSYVICDSSHTLSIPPELKNPLSMGWLTIAALFVISLPYQFCTMDMWQRTFSMSAAYESDDEFCKEVRKHLLRSIGEYTLLFWIFMSAGIVVRISYGEIEDPNNLLNAFLDVIRERVPGGYIWFSVVLVGIVSSIVSTVDSLLSSLVQTFMYDVYSTLFRKNVYTKMDTFSAEENRRFVDMSRFFIPVFGIAGVILVFFAFQVFAFLMNIYALVVVLFPSILYAILNNPGRKLSFWGPFASIATGFAVVIGMSVTGTFVLQSEATTFWAPVVGLGVSILGLFLGCRIDKIDRGA